MLRLLSLLQTRRSWAGHELAERLEVTLRTVRRDIERLRAMGYPVESVTGPVGGYPARLGRRHRGPPRRSPYPLSPPGHRGTGPRDHRGPCLCPPRPSPRPRRPHQPRRTVLR
nr:helix-turn-helix domain-containing protein [Nocardia brasiliensis]